MSLFDFTNILRVDIKNIDGMRSGWNSQLILRIAELDDPNFIIKMFNSKDTSIWREFNSAFMILMQGNLLNIFVIMMGAIEYLKLGWVLYYIFENIGL